MVKKPKFQEFKAVYEDRGNYPTLTHVAKKFQVSPDTVKKWRLHFLSAGNELRSRSQSPTVRIDLEDSGNELEKQQLKAELKLLKSDLRDAQQKALTSVKLQSLIHEISGATFNKVPTWLKPVPGKRTLRGIPTLFLSDIHFDEFVDPAQIG